MLKDQNHLRYYEQIFKEFVEKLKSKRCNYETKNAMLDAEYDKITSKLLKSTNSIVIQTNYLPNEFLLSKCDKSTLKLYFEMR